MKYLIIAEKPSVATDLSKALSKEFGKFAKKGKSRDTTYFESDRAAITSAVGHLVEWSQWQKSALELQRATRHSREI